jgi:hypothetical protein
MRCWIGYLQLGRGSVYAVKPDEPKAESRRHSRKSEFELELSTGMFCGGEICD